MGDISFEEAKKAMIAKRFGGNASGASTGGGGSVRRKKKGALKSGGGMPFTVWKYHALINETFR